MFHWHERRAASDALFFYGPVIYQLLKCMKGCQCTMGIVLCHNGMSTNGLRGSKKVTQALNMRNGLDQQLHAWLVSQPKQF
jgi:hypothetical protein